MIIGVIEIGFKIFECFSLKDKRRVVKSMKDKTRRLFNVSIVEAGENEILNYAVLGLACVSNSRVVVESTFDKIINFYENNFNIEVASVRKEFL